MAGVFLNPEMPEVSLKVNWQDLGVQFFFLVTCIIVTIIIMQHVLWTVYSMNMHKFKFIIPELHYYFTCYM